MVIPFDMDGLGELIQSRIFTNLINLFIFGQRKQHTTYSRFECNLDSD